MIETEQLQVLGLVAGQSILYYYLYEILGKTSRKILGSKHADTD